jgi:L-lactate dehydrogenase complex protein LldG
MTNRVIESVRRSLGRTALSPVSQRPAIYEARRPGSSAAEIELFLGEIGKLAGVGKKVSPAGIEAAIENLVTDQHVHKATLWATPLLKRLQVAENLGTLGVELVPPKAGKHDIAQCDLGITEADFILAETGTLVLRSSAEKPRAVSLVPRIHLAIVTPAALRADMHQVFAEAKGSPYLVFITGPSRTSDIELTVTLGVHGPQNLFVWMLAE